MHPHSLAVIGAIYGRFQKNSPLAKCTLLGTSIATNIAPHALLIRSYGF